MIVYFMQISVNISSAPSQGTRQWPAVSSSIIDLAIITVEQEPKNITIHSFVYKYKLYVLILKSIICCITVMTLQESAC